MEEFKTQMTEDEEIKMYWEFMRYAAIMIGGVLVVVFLAWWHEPIPYTAKYPKEQTTK